MKKDIKVIGMLVLVVVLLAIGGITYSTQALPNVEAPADLKVELTEARIERGEYLANSVCVCMDDFQAASQTYKTQLDAAGHFTTICNHGGGHDIPRPAAPSVLQFFADNGFGDWPSPYAAAGLPAGFPSYCSR